MAELAVKEHRLEAEFRAVEGSRYYQSPKLYKENGFRERETAEELIASLLSYSPEYRTVTENGKNSYPAVLRDNTRPTDMAARFSFFIKLLMVYPYFRVSTREKLIPIR